jgi:hypothetical protein
MRATCWAHLILLDLIIVNEGGVPRHNSTARPRVVDGGGGFTYEG